jgi:two-component system response regulator AtoC
MPRILIADDDTALRNALRDALQDEGHDVSEVDSGEKALAAFAEPAETRPELLLIDVRMPGKTGLDVLRELRATQQTPLPVLVMTGYGSSNVAIEAMQLGAYDYLTKPFEIDDLIANVDRFFNWRALNNQVVELPNRNGEVDPSEVIIGNSAAMQEVYKVIGRVARSDATVLITGETGTGKELVASVLHRSSSYARGPLIKVNCAALPETLLESELFGHEKGAFTGAIGQRKGRFEMADKGTIFLDEIGEMSLPTQKKLLRVLQEREFERVGGSVTVKIDTRVISATNKHLPTEIEEGRFREDLYYRLNIISIHLPPLRERIEDVPALSEHFLHKHRFSVRSNPARLSHGALQMLMEYHWPGNVRELENVIERAVILAQGAVISEQHIDFSNSSGRQTLSVVQRLRDGAGLETILKEVEREAVTEALRLSQGDEHAASELLKMPLTELQVRLASA